MDKAGVLGSSSVMAGEGRALGGVEGAFAGCSSGTGLRLETVGMLIRRGIEIGAGRRESEGW